MEHDRFHFIGIGGTGMSGLARIMKSRGCVVAGSDTVRSEATAQLEQAGIRVCIGHRAENLDPAVTTVVRSAAIRDDNPEWVEAVFRKVRTAKYAAMLGEVMKEKTAIGVSGCHGKTTTTAMISYIFEKAGVRPSFLCGGRIPQLNGNAEWNEGKHFIAEACEYDRSFLNLPVNVAVVTNIEEDHLDYYRDIGDIVGAFRDFVHRAGDSGTAIASLDSPHVGKALEGFKGTVERYSLTEETDWRAIGIEVKNGRWQFDVLKYGKPFGEFTLGVPGEHNVSNALAAIAVAGWAGIGREIVQVALSEFRGVQRRFERIAEEGGITLVDDYAHHPTEIQAVLQAARELYPNRKIWCVFQPHQHSRTRMFMKDFARAFQEAQMVLVTDIYAARDTEEDRKRVSSADLVKLLDQNGKPALHLAKFEDVLDFLTRKAEPGTVLITMGAGTVTHLAHTYAGQLKSAVSKL